MKFKKPFIITLSLMLPLYSFSGHFPTHKTKNQRRQRVEFISKKPEPSTTLKSTGGNKREKKKPRKTYSRRKAYNLLISNGIDREIASFVFSKEFKVYPFAFPSKNRSRTQFTYSDYVNRINPKEKAEIAYNFLVSHKKLLKDIEKFYGIDAVHLASLVAVETSGGRFRGSFKMFNALFSNFLRRTILIDKNMGDAKSNIRMKNFYLNQIKAISFLLKNGYSPFTVSSKAGAIGIVQFMPSSVKLFGIDANNDGIINLFEVEDALYSAAFYLKLHGGDEDIYKAFLRYNGHEWFAMVLEDIVSRVNYLMIKRNFKWEEDIQGSIPKEPLILQFFRSLSKSKLSNIPKTPVFMGNLDLFLVPPPYDVITNYPKSYENRSILY